MKKYALIRYTLCHFASILCFIITAAGAITSYVSAKLFEADNMEFKTAILIVGISCVVSIVTVYSGVYLNYLKNYYSELYDYYNKPIKRNTRHIEINPWYEYVVE